MRINESQDGQREDAERSVEHKVEEGRQAIAPDRQIRETPPGRDSVQERATDEEILSLPRSVIILRLFWRMGSFVTFYVIIAIDKHIHFLRK